jgi:hypothetical protein
MSSHSRAKHDRCTQLSPSGRRCRSLLAPGHDSLCVLHARRQEFRDDHEFRTAEAKATVARVLGTRQQFRTATQVNDALAKLFALRARKLISQSDAHLLAYISQLLLFSIHMVHAEFTDVYTQDTWTRLVERSLKHPGAKLPPLDVPAGSESVPAPSFPAGKPGEVDFDPPSNLKHLLRKQKRRPLPKTGRQLAMQVFAQAAEDYALREQRSDALLAEQDQSQSAEESALVTE